MTIQKLARKILILDKPQGITSHDACDKVKQILKISKAGHAGTLDPMVTGVLLIALENATKFMPLLNKLPKEYVGRAHLHKNIDKKTIEKAIKEKFLGKIKQVPPKKSRVLRVEREREIYKFEILKKQKQDFWFLVNCEAGTYVRKLIDDLGKELKIGAHMAALRRMKQGSFSEEESIKLENLKNKIKLKKSLLSLEQVVKRLNLAYISVDKEAKEKLENGMFLVAKEFKIKGGFAAQQILPCLSSRKVFALVKVFFSSDEIKDIKGYVLKPERII